MSGVPITMQHHDGTLRRGAQVIHEALKVKADAGRLKVAVPLPLHARVRKDVLRAALQHLQHINPTAYSRCCGVCAHTELRSHHNSRNKPLESEAAQPPTNMHMIKGAADI